MEDDVNGLLKCPYCSNVGDDCPHVLAIFDHTFEEVFGPASEFLSHREDGQSNMTQLSEACGEIGDHHIWNTCEGGPGMSSLEEWHWVQDLPVAMTLLRKRMQ